MSDASPDAVEEQMSRIIVPSFADAVSVIFPPEPVACSCVTRPSHAAILATVARSCDECGRAYRADAVRRRSAGPLVWRGDRFDAACDSRNPVISTLEVLEEVG